MHSQNEKEQKTFEEKKNKKKKKKMSYENLQRRQLYFGPQI